MSDDVIRQINAPKVGWTFEVITPVERKYYLGEVLALHAQCGAAAAGIVVVEAATNVFINTYVLEHIGKWTKELLP